MDLPIQVDSSPYGELYRNPHFRFYLENERLFLVKVTVLCEFRSLHFLQTITASQTDSKQWFSCRNIISNHIGKSRFIQNSHSIFKRTDPRKDQCICLLKFRFFFIEIKYSTCNRSSAWLTLNKFPIP